MRLKLLRFVLFINALFFFNSNVWSQNCVPTGLNHSTVTSLCSQVCRDFNFQVPDLRSTSSYTVINIPYAPYAYVTPGGTTDNTLYQDDAYSDVFNLPFPFCFYDRVYTEAVISSNGLVTFDVTRKSLCPNVGDAAWNITNPLPFGGQAGCGDNNYPKLSIMGVFMDLDPRAASSAPNRKIEWRVEGTAPCRRFVVSYFNVGVYQNFPCGSLNSLISFQIVMTESTGVIDIHIEKKQACSATSAGGRAIMGIQGDITTTPSQFLTVRQKDGNDPAWTANNESFRFVPTGGTSRFVSADLLRLDHTPVATATAANTTPGLLDLNFTNICTPGTSTDYVLRTRFSSCSDPSVFLEALDTITVQRNPELNATATTTNTLCGNPSGSIQVTVPPGVGIAPYTFTLNPGPGQIVQTGPSPMTFNNVAQGIHTVTVVDNSSNCTSTLTNINVGRTNNLAASITSTTTTCPSATNGSITVTPTTGSGLYTFVLNPGNITQTSNTSTTFSGLAANSYTATVTDVSGCVSNPIPITVTAGTVFSPAVAFLGIGCAGATTTISVNLSIGVGPFSLVLDGGTPVVTSDPTYWFRNVAAGYHTVVVTDLGTGCVSEIVEMDIEDGAPLSTTITASSALCFATATGSITVTQPTMGIPPYEYSLDGVNWQPGNIFSNLVANTYTVYLRASNGCNGSQTVVINQPQILTATANAVAVRCNGESNGTITVTPTGGTAPYQYSIDGGANWQPSNIFNVPANSYTITIRDANLCTTTQTATVTQPTALTASATTTNASCNGGNDGRITVTAIGGNTTYEYSIDGGTNWQPSNIFNVAPNNYTVNVRDNLGCTYQFNTIVGLTNDLTFTPQVDATICESKSTQLELVSNANQYAWSPATGLSNATIANPIANPTTTTTYTVIATFGRCTTTDDVIVNVNPAPIPDAGVDAFICYGQTYTLQGTGGVQYTWTPSTYLSSTSGANPISSPLRTITYTLAKVVDAIGCESVVTDDIIVDVTPPVKVNTFPYDTIGYPGDTFQLRAVAAVSSANIFTWSPGIRLSNTSISNPTVTVGNIGDDIVYQVTAETAAGCKGEGYVRIRVYKGPDAYVPTGFTPNGDGLNDKFTPFPVGLKSINYFRVFNRWGQPIFSTTRLNDGWDGTINGQPQPSGTYVWMIQGITKDDKPITKKGVVTLIR